MKTNKDFEEKHREKIIRKIGTSMGITFNKEEQNLYNLNVNDKLMICFYKIEDNGEDKRC